MTTTNPLNLFAQAMQQPIIPSFPETVELVNNNNAMGTTSPSISRASSGTGIGEDSGVFSPSPVPAEPLPPSPSQLPFPQVQQQQRASPPTVPIPVYQPVPTTMVGAVPGLLQPVQYVSVVLPSQVASHHLLVQTQPQYIHLVPQQPGSLQAPPAYQPPLIGRVAHPIPTSVSPAAPTMDYGAQWRKKHGNKKIHA